MDRRSAVAGSWYPAETRRLREQITSLLARAGAGGLSAADAINDAEEREAGPPGLVALVAPHAGLQYSGHVAARAYARLARIAAFDVIVLVGPSHHVGFDGVAVWPNGRFLNPLAPLTVDEALAERLMSMSAMVHDRPEAHAREHSLEMQLPFLAQLAPDTPILPLVMGRQVRDTAMLLGDLLSRALAGRRALLVASSDLSHFYPAARATALDAAVLGEIERFDHETLMALLERRPDHACGGGPVVSVMRAARHLGASGGEVLAYADSGDISGDKSSVVGYVAAAFTA